MRAAKFVLVCLVCLGISFQGFASVVGAHSHCPMTQPGTDPAMAAAMQAAGMKHDCCTDAATFARTGKMCKSDLQCQPAGLAPLVSVALNTPVQVCQVIATLPDPLIESVSPSLVWRPPALI